jgi:hypothetical protein
MAVVEGGVVKLGPKRAPVWGDYPGSSGAGRHGRAVGRFGFASSSQPTDAERLCLPRYTRRGRLQVRAATEGAGLEIWRVENGTIAS